MLEQRRVDYLRSMGITLWMPRKALPHAPESRWIAEDKPQERHEHIHLDNGHESARPAAAADLLRAGQPMAAHPDTGARVAAEVAGEQASENTVAAPAISDRTENAADSPTSARTAVNNTDQVSDSPVSIAPSLEPPRFALEFIQLSDYGVWVVDAGQPLDRVIPFACRVLNTFGVAPPIVPQPTSFRWPFIESRHQDQSEAVALQALKAQWQFFSGQGAGYIITLGESAREWMAKVGVNSHHHIADIESLMASGQHKRALWLALHALAER